MCNKKIILKISVNLLLLSSVNLSLTQNHIGEKTLVGLTGVDDTLTAEALEKGLSKNMKKKHKKFNDKNKSSAGRTA